MLCYLSSRATSDVTYDTFRWITLDRRCLMRVLLPVVGICIIALIFTGFGANIFEELRSNYRTTDFYDSFSPFALSIFRQSMPWTFCYTLMTFVTVLFVVPLLCSYFAYKTSVRNLSLMGAVRLFKNYGMKSLGCAMIAAATVLLMFNAGFFMSIILYMIDIAIIPCIITGYCQLKGVDKHLFWALRSALLLALIALVIDLLPLLAITVICMIDEMPVLTLGLSSSHLLQVGINVAFIVTMYLSFCASVLFSLTGAVILHGTLFAKALQ